MTIATPEHPMVEEKPKTLSVKLHEDVVASARIVSAFRNEPMTELLSGVLRPILAKLEREEIAKRTREQGGGAAE